MNARQRITTATQGSSITFNATLGSMPMATRLK